MADDGYLSGGEVDGKDVFADARSKASMPPDVLVGPDSNPVLSFTSGLEGRPKVSDGARLRDSMEVPKAPMSEQIQGHFG
jgi:hypothetical protein